MAYQAEVICGVWTGALVRLDGVVHRGSVAPLAGCFGEVNADCGLSGLGYLTGDQDAPETRCQACPPVRSINVTD